MKRTFVSRRSLACLRWARHGRVCGNWRIQQYVHRGPCQQQRGEDRLLGQCNIKGKTYCFSNEQAKAEFLKSPDANLAKAQAFYSKSHQG
jgi:hypothetical protein